MKYARKSIGSRKMAALKKAILVLMLSCFVIGNAQAVVFHDAIHNIQTMIGHLMSRIEAVKAVGQDATQYMRQLQHYRQQLADLSMMFRMHSIGMNMEFKERALDHGMAQECPGTSGLPSISDLWNLVAVNDEDDISAQQLMRCQQIVMLKNQKYNEMVRLLKNVEARANNLEDINNDRFGIGTSEGKMNSSSNQIQLFVAHNQVDMQYSKTVLESYDAYIQALEEDQQRLAMMAMQGKKSIWGTVAQGVTLKAALRAAKSRER
ncbi:hypothetical protein [Pseudoxanthomonas wuyuanensis]|uniref:Type IV secretion system protein VirB5 n=1 Tax=Pseudoxanthomonas wuyuanensis TaxID=1073196 RepID=A0A286DDS3_9GAMM|nr:hypothetical protein [Pseudoxanthomonas wuyuanensis]KAF1716640.1 hypothetical protein CSC75_19305 [Pseudoxanthomonas wuyuanensis]SOD56801.1 hypothetical protein SAMN06296416_11115 [Pseudoxanthomonas wuyuanensis]